ncbi:MAG: M2 family metallopeptidase [Planctomycetota bacterium]
MKYNSTVVTSLVISFFLTGCIQTAREKQLEQFIEIHIAKVEPLATQANLAYWDASTTGRPEDYNKLKQLQLKIRQIYSDPQEYALLKDMKESGQIRHARAVRQLDKLYYAYLKNQIEPELLEKLVDSDSKIQEKYNTFRGTIDGKKVTMSDIYTILTTEKDCRKRELAWRASKQVGDAIVDDLIELVKLRNEAARKVGFDNYHTLSVVTGEQNIKELDRIFKELCELTSEPFARLKKELLASQLHNHIVHKVLKLKSDEGVSYVGQREVGNFIREKVFKPGDLYHWNDMIARATGEPLTPKYFVEQFVK